MARVLNAEAVQQAFVKLGLPFRFSAEEVVHWSTVQAPSDGTPMLCFPTPRSNAGLNLLNLRKLLGVDPNHPPSFFDHPWYLEEAFGQSDCSPGWHVIESEVWPESMDRSFDFLRTQTSGDFTFPTAVEVVLMLFLHYVVFGEQHLMKKHTWCADEASLGRFVTVGAFGRNGVFISGHPPAYSSRGLGLCRKLTLPAN